MSREKATVFWTEEMVGCLLGLQALSSLKSETLSTKNGSILITTSRLVAELDQFVQERGGRGNLLEFQTQVGVEYHYVERAAKALVESRDGEIVTVQADLLNSAYRESLTAKVNEHLRLSGWLLISELSRECRLPADWLQNVGALPHLPSLICLVLTSERFLSYEMVDTRLGTSIMGVKDDVDRNLLYTDEHLNTLKLTLKTQLSSLMSPTAMPTLHSRFPDLPQRLFQVVTEAVSKDASLPGKLKAGVYTPNSHFDTVCASIANQYSQNGYISLEDLLKQGIEESVPFLEERYPSATRLTQCALSPSFIAELDISLNECIETGSWCDLQDLLPRCIVDGDLPTLLRETSAFGDGQQSAELQLLNNRFIVSSRFLDHTRNVLKDLVDSKVREQRTQTQAERSRASKSTRKGNEAPLVSLEEIIVALRKAYPGEEDEMLQSIAPIVAPDVRKAIHDGFRAVFLSDEKTKEPHDANGRVLEETVSGTWCHVQLCEAGLTHFKDSTASKKLQIYLCETLCSSLLESVLRHQQLLHAGYHLPATASTNLSPKEFDALLDSLPKDCADHCRSARKELLIQDLQGFLRCITSLYSTCDGYHATSQSSPLLPPSTSSPATLISVHERSLLSQLQPATEPALILHVAVLLLFLRIHVGTLIHASGRFVPMILKNLEGSLKSLDAGEGGNAWDLLTKYQREIVAGLKDPARVKGQEVSELGERVKKFVLSEAVQKGNNKGL